jgi:peptidoglycan/LPS O-acetylase OafA/YrhL
MTEPLRESQKIQSLEGLRGVMAAWVILGHLAQTFEWHVPMLNRDVLAVDVFIMLSGFVIARLIDVRAEPYGAYITRRALRIFPLWLLVLAVSTLMVGIQLQAAEPFAFNHNVDSTRVTFAQDALAALPAHLATHLVLAQGLVPEALLPGTNYTLVGQGWSISLEWQFYLVAPLILWGLTQRRWLPTLLGVALLMATARWFDMGFLGSKILHFLIGICSYRVVSRNVGRWNWIAATLALVVAAFVKDGITQAYPQLIWWTVLISTYAARGSLANLPARILGSRPAIHFGEMGYSLYLVHMIPLYLSLFWLEQAGVKGPAMQAGVAAATLVGAYVLGRLSLRFVEKPGIALGAWLTRRPAQREFHVSRIVSKA